MFRPIGRWFCFLVIFAGGGSAHAHTGYENEIDVRIFADRMEVNLRATLGFAWKILGKNAPADAGEAGQQIAAPFLEQMAPGLFEVTSGGKVMIAKSVTCMFEVDQHVFCRVVFDRPPTWPLLLKANYFDLFDPLTYGTVRIFDQTDDPYRHDIEAVAEGKVFRNNPAFTHDPAPPAGVAEAPPPRITEKPEPRGIRGYVLAALLLVMLWGIRLAFIKKTST